MQRRCQIWAVLNITPDSFSDGGQFFEADAALARAEQLLAQGADVLDIGGASSRPAGQSYGSGAVNVSATEEIRRVVPVVERAVAELGARVSVDTTRAEVAAAALRVGASIINDVSMGSEPALLKAVAEADAELVLMHTRGDGSLTADNGVYADVVEDVARELVAAAQRAQAVGVQAQRIWLDPGVGFAKSPRQSVAVIAGVPRLLVEGYRVLVGPSRKSFIRGIESEAALPVLSTPAERVGGTAAAVTLSAALGAHAVRVHDVPVMLQAVLIAEALSQSAMAGRALGAAAGHEGTHG